MTSPSRKILHIIQGLYQGGAEKLLLNTIKLFPEYEHHVACFKGSEEFMDLFREVAVLHVRKSRQTFNLPNLLFLRQLEKQLQPCIIHSHLLKANWLSRVAFRNKNNLVNSIHSQYGKDAFPFHFYTRRMEKYSYRLSRARLVFVSDYVREDYARFISLKRESFVLRNFVEKEYFDVVTTPYTPGTPLRLVAVGNLKPLKNHSLLIEAFKELKDFPISLDVYGDGLPRNNYESEVALHSLQVDFKGKTASLAPVIGNYHALIFPSRYEGLSLALLEAMAAGMPLLLSDIEVFKALVQENAFYFDPENAGDCKRAILKAFREGFPVASGQKNKALVLEFFEEGLYKRNLNLIYQKLVEKQPLITY